LLASAGTSTSATSGFH